MAVTLLEYMNMGPMTLSLPTAPDVPITRTASGRAWVCAEGKHRWHRDEDAAKWCAWRAQSFSTVTFAHFSSLYTEATGG